MLFVTYQPLWVKQDLDAKGIAYPKSQVLDLGEHFFANAIDEDIVERILLTGVQMPNVEIIFETCNYYAIDSVAWVNAVTDSQSYTNVEGYSKALKSFKYMEYLVPAIRKEWIKSL